LKEDQMSELLRNWASLDLAEWRGADERSSADLTAVIAISALGLSLSFIAVVWGPFGAALEYPG
jgi:hypothetical protein